MAFQPYNGPINPSGPINIGSNAPGVNVQTPNTTPAGSIPATGSVPPVTNPPTASTNTKMYIAIGVGILLLGIIGWWAFKKK